MPKLTYFLSYINIFKWAEKAVELDFCLEREWLLFG